jgi:hypothetical protein
VLALGDLDRVVVDPGRVDRVELSGWFERTSRSLRAGPGRRAVLVIPRDALGEAAVAQLPPTAVIVLPPGAAAGLEGLALLWIATGETADRVRAIDLRHRAPVGTDLAAWFDRFVTATTSSAPPHPVPAAELLPIADLLPGFDRDGTVAASTREFPQPPGSLWQPEELGPGQLWGWVQALDRGRPLAGQSAALEETNRRYALALALELERLIDGGEPNLAALAQLGDRMRSRSDPRTHPTAY